MNYAFASDNAAQPVTTGTAAGAPAVAAACRSHHALVCHEAAHLRGIEREP